MYVLYIVVALNAFVKKFYFYKTKPFFSPQGEKGSKGDEGTKVGEPFHCSIIPLNPEEMYKYIYM